MKAQAPIKHYTYFSRCPQCSTVYVLRDQQLKAGRGMVRCGNCFETYFAPKHFVKEPESALGALTATEQPLASAKSGPTVPVTPPPIQSPHATAKVPHQERSFVMPFDWTGVATLITSLLLASQILQDIQPNWLAGPLFGDQLKPSCAHLECHNPLAPK